MSRSTARFHSLDVSHALDHIHETFHISVTENIDLFMAVAFSQVLDEAIARNTMYSLVQTIQEVMLSDTRDVHRRFEEAIRRGNLYLEGRAIHEMGKLHVAIGLLQGEEMHITKTGAAEMYLVRHGQCTNVTANFDEPLYDEDGNQVGSTVGELLDTVPENEYFNNIATGGLAAGDILLISTGRLTKYLDEYELASFFGKSNLEVGFLNLEHRLKDDPDADLAILGLKMMPVEMTGKQTAANNASTDMEAAPVPTDLVSRVRHHAQLVRGGLNDPKQRKKLYTFGAIVLGIVLLISITTALGNNQDADFKLQVKQEFANAKNELTLARNSNIKGDRDDARKHLDEARKLIADLQSKNVASADVNSLLADVDKEADVANKVTRVSADTPFINAEGQFSGETLKGLAMSPDNQLYIYSSSSIFGPFINSTTTANKKYTIESSDLILDLTPFSDIRGFLLKLTPDKIAEFSNNSYKFVDSTGITWKSGNFIDTFGSNVYILGADQIWRYTRNKDAYRGPSPWLQKAEPTLKDAVSFALDGSIYVLMNNGELKKFFRNKPVDLQVVDVPEEALKGVDAQSKVLTEADWKHVYVFNHAQNSVASLVKVQGKDQLAFDRQIAFEGAEVITVTLSADETTLFALTKEGKILRVEL